jgi:hypothetical protein
MKSAFTEKEIGNIASQQFIESVGKFTSADFRVGAYSDMLGFYTELFLEAVPGQFLDVEEPEFRWAVGQKELPIILSRDYLALYNFGFAPSQGLPQFSPSTVGKLAMDIRISGLGKQTTLTGRVVGFSDRINSILVPEEFLAWANQTFGENESKDASRLILKVKNPMSQELRLFLKANGYEVSTGRLIGSQFAILLQITLSIVAILGVLILGLSFLVFLLIFQLLISQNAADIRLLLQIGYHPRQIGGLIGRRFAILFIGVVGLVLLLMVASRVWMVQYFENQGFTLNSGLHYRVWIAGISGALFLLLLNLTSIRRSVYRLS